MADETVTTTENPNPATTADPSASDQPNPNDTSNTDKPTPSDEGDEPIDLGKDGGDDADDKGADKGEQTDEEKAAEAARAELFGAPADDAAYEIVGLPEGMAIDNEALEAATPAFRELGLSNAGASKVAGVYAEHILPKVIEKAGESFKTDLETKIADQKVAWQDETLKAVKGEIELKTSTGDKIDFAGSGVKQVQQAAARAIDRVAPAGFREFLEETGLGSHPAMVAFAYKVGQLIAEDTDAGGGGGTPPGKPSRVEKYYPKK